MDDIRRVIGDLDIRTAAVLGEFEGLRYNSTGKPEIGTDALRAFRTDPRIRGAASAKYALSGGYLGILGRLEDAIGETLGLIRERAGN